jgi:hypothetical protein
MDLSIHLSNLLQTKVGMKENTAERKDQATERGSSTVELIMLLALISFVMLLLVGLGHTLITKPHAIVASRFAAAYQSANGFSPSPQLVSKAVSKHTETFRISLTRGGDCSAFSELSGSGLIGSAFGSVLGGFVGNRLITATAGTKPESGIIPRLTTINQTTSQYHLVSGTWTCKEGGDLFSLLAQNFGLGGLNLLPGKLSCCETYEGRR